MDKKETTVEKRRHERFKVRKGILVAVVNDYIKVGQIINISKGGIAFSYISKGEQLKGRHKINILLSRIDFSLKEVPFIVVSDLNLDSEIPFSTELMKQCSGQFGGLTNQQKSHLDYLLSYIKIAQYK